MGALCGCSSATHIPTATEITALKSASSQYQTLTNDYQSQILQAQEVVSSLTSKEAKERDENARIQSVLLNEIERKWTFLQNISALLDLKSDEDGKTGSNKADLTFEELDTEIKESLGREKTEIERLGLAQEEISDCLRVGLEEIQRDLRLLGKSTISIEGLEGHIPVLQTVLGQFSAFLEESIHIEDTNAKLLQHVSALQTELVSLASATSILEKEISKQESLNQDLTSSLTDVQTALQQHESEQISGFQKSLVLEQRKTELVERRESLLGDISSVRNELLELKEASREIDLKNSGLEVEIGQLTVVRSREEIEQYSIQLRESIAALKTRQQQLQIVAVEKENLLLTNAATISTLEEQVSALHAKAASADVNEKIASVQATLQDLISTLGENLTDSEEEP